MSSQAGLMNGFRAVRYSNGAVFYKIGGNWYRAIGAQPGDFIPIK